MDDFKAHRALHNIAHLRWKSLYLKKLWNSIIDLWRVGHCQLTMTIITATSEFVMKVPLSSWTALESGTFILNCEGFLQSCEGILLFISLDYRRFVESLATKKAPFCRCFKPRCHIFLWQSRTFYANDFQGTASKPKAKAVMNEEAKWLPRKL